MEIIKTTVGRHHLSTQFTEDIAYNISSFLQESDSFYQAMLKQQKAKGLNSGDAAKTRGMTVSMWISMARKSFY